MGGSLIHLNLNLNAKLCFIPDVKDLQDEKFGIRFGPRHSSLKIIFQSSFYLFFQYYSLLCLSYLLLDSTFAKLNVFGLILGRGEGCKNCDRVSALLTA